MSREKVNKSQDYGSAKIPKGLLKEMQHLAIDDERQVQELLAEAVKDYLAKRGRLAQE